MKTLRQILKQYITIYRIWKALKTIRLKRLCVFFVIRVFQILDNNASRFVNNLVNYISYYINCSRVFVNPGKTLALVYYRIQKRYE